MNNLATQKNKYNTYSKIIILVVGIYLLMGACIFKPALYGEGSNYLMTTVALENHGSLFFHDSDYIKAMTDFPDVYPTIKYKQDNNIHIGCKINLRDGNLVEHGWYFGTYSLCCIPIQLILKFSQFSQSYCFQLTNVVFYVLALCIILYKLNICDKNKFILILLLVFSPGVFHMLWPSAEVFEWSLIVMSLVFWHNKSYKRAAVLAALASTMNPTSIFIVFAIILNYLADLYINSKNIKKNKHISNVRDLIQILKNNSKDIMLTILCGIPSIIPFIYNYILFGKINLASAASGGDIKSFLNGCVNRFAAYLFDLNFGFLPYFHIVFIIFLILAIIGIFVKRECKTLFFCIAFFGTVVGYSLMPHINCGMTAIARYNSWSFPIFIFFVITTGCKFVPNGFINKIFYGSLYCSALLTMTISLRYGGISSPHIIPHTNFTPIAKYVLNNMPSMYNPFHFTFVSRTIHEDGGYHYEKPVIYSNEEGYIRKILVTPQTVNQLSNQIIGNNHDMEYLFNKINGIQGRKDGFYYINISPKYSLKLNN